ncbi:MAG TPA: malectin domain-containing carbohydrate-binding protein, partial [Terracidiphilus sp.]
IYTGANNYTDSQGNVWVPDTAASNVTISGGSSLYRPSPAPTVTGTNDPTLYQSERWGNSFSYTFNNLPTGYYSLTLKFAEIFYTNNQNNKGVRVFNVSINGQQVLTDFDIVADEGGALFADDKTFTGIVPNGSQIVVQFNGTNLGSDTNAKIDAAALNPLWSGAPYLGAGNESDAASFFDQLAQLSMQGYVSLGFSPAQLRIQNNEMHVLSATGLLVLGGDNLVNGNSASLMMTGNRIDGEIVENSDFATFGTAQKAQTDTNLAAFAIAFVPGVFYYLVTIVAVSRAVVSANMVTNGNFTDGYFPSLYLNDRAVQQAIISVMSNTLAGRISIFPQRNLNDTNLDAFTQSWNFLNTIVV